jgi:hypothetical protein
MNAFLPRFRRTAGVALAAIAAASTVVTTVAAAVVVAILVPATAAPAQADCLDAEFQASSWSTGPATGGFVAAVTITNTCDAPVDGWALTLTLPPGLGFSNGWSASWAIAGQRLDATPLPWNRLLDAGEAITIGFVGSWTGAYQDPLGCLINNRSCGGDPDPNEPPQVTLTRPNSSIVGVVSPCPFVLSAEAADPDGSIARVEFYVNDVLVGSDHTAPYRIEIGGLPPPRPSTIDWVAFARAYDGGVPSLSGDSAPVTFKIAIGDPIPESIFACASSITLPAGSSEAIRFGLFTSNIQPVTLAVNGSPDITVSPTVVTPSGRLVQATLTAAPGSTGATAVITASAPGLNPVSVSVTAS